MATPEWYTGDTWPPISFTVKDALGAAVDVSTSDSLRFIAKVDGGADVIAGAAAFCAVEFGGTADGTDGKVQYEWAAGDTDIPGDWIPECEVTWDELSTPPKIETFRLDSEKFVIKADND